MRSLWDAIKLLQEPEQISKALKNYIETTTADISAPDASGWCAAQQLISRPHALTLGNRTLLLDAAAAQNLPLCMELIRMKADPTIDTGNSILHSLVQIPNQEEKFEKEAGKFLDAVLKIAGPSFLDRRTPPLPFAARRLTLPHA